MSEACVRFVSGKFFLNDSGLTLSPKLGSLLPQYLDYQILSLTDEIYRLGRGTAQKNLDVEAFRSLRIAIPSDLDEQRRVVEILDQALSRISEITLNVEQNLASVRGLIDAQIGHIFSSAAAMTQLPFSELASFRNGVNFTKSSRGEAVKIVGVKDFQDRFSPNLDELESITIGGVLSDEDRLKKNDILFVRSNGNVELIGRSLLVGDIKEKIVHSGFTIRARLQSNCKVSPLYICHFVKSGAVRRQMVDSGNGANIKNLNQGILASLLIPIPSVAEQKKIITRIEDTYRKSRELKSIYQRKLATLDELKKSLLHQAFSGNL